jgi:septum formation protein|tara:strand:+ start:9788 stop:10366 length:579 start_codon:yes stop_codon:yes gene_type:complete
MLDLKNYKIILGSNSPRRKEILTSMGISFSINAANIDEKVPKDISAYNYAEFLAIQKCDYLRPNLKTNEILITADTTVLIDNQILNKPNNYIEAGIMLKKISGNSHSVITGVCISSTNKKITFTCETEVKFKKLSNQEIEFYINKYQPLDKAGSYGIQEWIGLIGVEEIKGSYTNVVGLPSSKLYNELNKFI